MESVYDHFTKELERRFRPYLETAAEEFRQGFSNIEARVGVVRNGNKVMLYSFALVLEIDKLDWKPGAEDESLVPLLDLTVNQSRIDRDPEFRGGVLIDDWSYGDIFEKPVKVTAEVEESLLNQIEQELPRLKQLFWEGTKEYLDTYKTKNRVVLIDRVKMTL